MPPISIDGTDISSLTVDGTDVQEVTMDGDVVYTNTIEGVIYQGNSSDAWVDDTADGSSLYSLSTGSRVFAADITTDYAAVGSKDESAYVFDMSDGSQVYNFTEPTYENVNVQINSQYVAYSAGYNNGGLYVKNLSDGSTYQTDDWGDNTFVMNEDYIWYYYYNLDTFTSGWHGRRLSDWQEVYTTSAGTSAVLASSDSYFAYGGGGDVTIINADDGATHKTFSNRAGGAIDFVGLTDNHVAYAWDGAGTIYVFDISTGNELTNFMSEDGDVTSCAMNGDYLSYTANESAFLHTKSDWSKLYNLTQNGNNHVYGTALPEKWA